MTTTQLPDGRTASELSVKWWQWSDNAPDVTDPLADETGDFCGYGQKGEVWFLSGSYTTEKIVRQCKVPTGKYIFFPVINMRMWDGPDGLGCSRLQEDVTTVINTARDLKIEVDGRRLADTKQYRYPAETCFSIPGDVEHYASDGYWILLKPLKPGKHIIRFSGRIGDGGDTVEDFNQDIHYVLEVN